MEPVRATSDSHNQRINELIYDEDKIVTSISLARELKISRSDAQSLLNTFIKNYDNKKLDIHVTYLLYGLLTNGNGVGVYLVKEEELNDKKCLFENITTEIIYSIQNGKHVGFNMIALANSVQENSVPLITSKNCIKRNRKSKKILIAQPTTSSVKQNGTSLKNSPATSGEVLNTATQHNHKSSSQKMPKGKQGGIASFFTKSAAKTESTVKVQSINSEESEKSKPQTEVAASKTGSEIDVSKKQTGKAEKMETNSDNEKSALKQTQCENSNKKRKKVNKDKGPNKKRKRIQQICDSDSDDIFDDGENNDIVEMSDEEPVHVPVANPVPVPKNKKRKAVDKTYMDDEGFIVTTTEYIYETGSEGEEEEPPKPKPVSKVSSEKKNDKVSPDVKAPVVKGKNKKVTNGKQPTLMSFFKKS